MAFVSPRMSLKVWNAASDPYDHEQLADNHLKLDQHDHSEGRGVPIGGAGIQEGAITSTHIYPGSLGVDSLADNSITLGKLDPALVSALIAMGAVVKITENAAASNVISFTGIPNTFRHLRVAGIAKGSATAELLIRLNADSGTNYTWALDHQSDPGQDVGLTLGTADSVQAGWMTTDVNKIGTFEFTIFDYASARHKTVHFKSVTYGSIGGVGGIHVWSGAGIWSSTAAITQIDLSGNSSNIVSPSYATLYGLA